MTRWIFAALLIAPIAALAQDEMPAVDTESPAVNTESPAVNTESPAAGTESPAVNTESPAVSTKRPARAPRPTTRSRARSGSSIVGEQETPLGLYIMPWRNSTAASGLDRPARFLRESLVFVDADVFRRQVEFYRALTEHLEETGRATP